MAGRYHGDPKLLDPFSTLDVLDPFRLDLDWLPADGLAVNPAGARTTASSEAGAAAATASWTSPEKRQIAGALTVISGILTSSVGAYHQAVGKRGELESEASSREFQSDIADINARSAESEAQGILQAGEFETARVTMAAGAAKAGHKATMAGRGLRLGAGTTAEVLATDDLITEVEVNTISSNATRAANASRMRAQDFRNQADIGRVSAANARRSARTINPYGIAFGNAFSSAMSLDAQWSTRR